MRKERKEKARNRKIEKTEEKFKKRDSDLKMRVGKI